MASCSQAATLDPAATLRGATLPTTPLSTYVQLQLQLPVQLQLQLQLQLPTAVSTGTVSYDLRPYSCT